MLGWFGGLACAVWALLTMPPGQAYFAVVALFFGIACLLVLVRLVWTFESFRAAVRRGGWTRGDATVTEGARATRGWLSVPGVGQWAVRFAMVHPSVLAAIEESGTIWVLGGLRGRSAVIGLPGYPFLSVIGIDKAETAVG